MLDKEMNSAIDMIDKAANELHSGNSLNSVSPVNSIAGTNFGEIGKIPLLAKGGTVFDGSAIVGEAGAELVELPQGARVTPLNDNNNAFASMESKLDALQAGFFALANAILNVECENAVANVDIETVIYLSSILGKWKSNRPGYRRTGWLDSSSNE